MSKHNYSQYSKKKHADNTESFGISAISTDNNPIIPEIKMVVETVDTVVLPETVTGFVSNCSKLNVRANPDITSEVVCTLDNTTEVMIDLNKSTDEWFSICTAADVEGFCMRKFINAKL